VMLWDFGVYEISEGDPSAALKKGKLSLALCGKKLKGNWHLVRMRRREEDSQNKNAWLLIKAGEDSKPVSARADDKSVKSGKTMKQIADDGGSVWESNSEK
ncbi:MAG: DNA polymerase ligase N-terminal domain-containing protein, partial [Limisphaerales bacterium]